jgi:hypothetical protein
LWSSLVWFSLACWCWLEASFDIDVVWQLIIYHTRMSRFAANILGSALCGRGGALFIKIHCNRQLWWQVPVLCFLSYVIHVSPHQTNPIWIRHQAWVICFIIGRCTAGPLRIVLHTYRESTIRSSLEGGGGVRTGTTINYRICTLVLSRARGISLHTFATWSTGTTTPATFIWKALFHCDILHCDIHIYISIVTFVQTNKKFYINVLFCLTSFKLNLLLRGCAEYAIMQQLSTLSISCRKSKHRAWAEQALRWTEPAQSGVFGWYIHNHRPR